MPCDDCSRAETCPPCVNEPEDSPHDRCKCGHIRFRHQREDAADRHCANASCQCEDFRPRGKRMVDVELPEPPLTPEEEEELSPEPSCCGNPNCTCEGSCDCDQAPEDCDCDSSFPDPCPGQEEVPPPRPERRPPYAVAYSVHGHLYEVGVPGDASVRAVDGALIVTHHLGPVAGIVQILPIINEGGTDGAEPDGR